MTSEKDQSLETGFFENPLALCRQTLPWRLLIIAEQRKVSPEYEVGRLCRLLVKGPGAQSSLSLSLAARETHSS